MDFKLAYDRKKYLDFFQNSLLTDDFIPAEEELEIDVKTKYIDEVNLIGKVESLDLRILEIKHNSEFDPRSSLTDESSNIMKNYNITNALAIFYSDKSDNYRLSLINIELKLDGSRIKRIVSNKRRFSYFLGPDAKVNTPYHYLYRKGRIKSFVDLRERFSVEVVTKKFFDEFRVRFKDLKEEFEKSNKSVCLGLRDKYGEDYEEVINKYCFTFLGRIVFIYFLQRKGWIENNKNYIKEYLNNNSFGIYIDFLEPLFFEVFAKKTPDRNPDIREKYKNTPYLNGGLFEKSKLEEENDVIFLKDRFLKDLIFDFFEIYNFTVDENTLYEQEVSIDPEMLGKVFENTLEEKERGKKGTFYTPREIVNFMVREALFHFLINETVIEKTKLKDFIYDQKIDDFSLNEIRIVDDILGNIKVLDPAVGSGAFPVEMLNVLVELRKKLDVKVGKNINEIELKKQFIRHNLYGVDIDSGAIEIAKLRLWLALIVDYEKEDIEPLPNLDFQFRIGNSLQERVAGFEVIPEDYFSAKEQPFIDLEQLELVSEKKEKYTPMKLNISSSLGYLDEMTDIIDKYFLEENSEKRKRYKEDFDALEEKVFETRIEDLKNELIDILDNIRDDEKKKKLYSKKDSEIEKLEQLKKEGIHKLFIPKLHFSEVFKEKGGFDIVIGNPPYGVRVDDEIKKDHNLNSKDSYGVFISSSIRRFLKPSGVLSFIISDTWLTIKTHLKLRQQVLSKQLHKIIRLNQDCFDATVNACIVILTKKVNKNDEIVVADLTNISTRNEAEELREKLHNLERFVGFSTPKFAVYKYNQDLIKTNSNLPIFVGSPKLFKLMDDSTCKIEEKEIGNKKIKVRLIEFNGKVIELVRFGDIADVVVGLQTGDNKYYIYQNPDAERTYKSIEEYKEFLLIEDDMEKIRNNEGVRLKIIDIGIHKSKSGNNFDPDLWFEGRYIIPYDKGGESDTESGWLPNYYVPTNFFIDWSMEAVKRLKTLTCKERNKIIGKSGGDNKLCSRFQNKDFYFKEGITFSWAGVYCPTFRFNSLGPFDHGSSSIFFEDQLINYNYIIANLCSKTFKLIQRVFINHSINFGVDDIKEVPIFIFNNERIILLVEDIVKKQKQNKRYDYFREEQKEIDKLIYDIYGLNCDDINEVETWYTRRFPKLSNF